MARDDNGTLELSAFIRETLVEIVRGVEQARDAIKKMETNAEICPTGLRFEKDKSPAPYKPGRGFIQEVLFDVAITVSKEHSAEGGGKGSLSIGVPSLPWLGGVGAEGDLTYEHQRGRHVTFKVPVLLPSEAYPLDDSEMAHLLISPKNLERLLQALERAQKREGALQTIEDLKQEIGLDDNIEEG
jgi:hypothetical protein